MIRAVCVILLGCLLTTTAHAESEIVTFPVTEFSGETTMLRAKLNRPEGDGPFPAVALLHGCNGPNFVSTLDEQIFEPMGYVTLVIDSFGPRGLAHACDSTNAYVAPPSIRALDSHAGKAFLARLSYVNDEQIGVVGWSHGAMSILRAISNDVLNQPDRQAPFKAAVAFYPLCPTRLTGTDAPLLILIGSADTSTPLARCESLSLAGDSEVYEIIVYPGATHAFDWVDSPGEFYGHRMIYDAEVTEDAYRRMFDFLALHVQAP
ncbi:MAG: dienelactone hydrolase family protein [Pseudomonadota bacterium]